jgi:hypothetical protein
MVPLPGVLDENSQGHDVRGHEAPEFEMHVHVEENERVEETDHPSPPLLLPQDPDGQRERMLEIQSR